MPKKINILELPEEERKLLRAVNVLLEGKDVEVIFHVIVGLLGKFMAATGMTKEQMKSIIDSFEFKEMDVRNN